MHKRLCFEIGVEELPAIPFLKELPNISSKWQSILEKNRVQSSFSFFYTPRRLVFLHESFPIAQLDSYEEFFGMPLEIAKKDGVWSEAALGFAKKCGVDINNLEVVKRGNKEVLYYKKQIKGKEVKELFNQMINEFLCSLNFGKSMHWLEPNVRFIRPIRWSFALFEDEFLEYELFGIKSSNYTFGHRVISYEPLRFNSIDEYFEILQKNGVILNQDKRREKIISEIDLIQKEYDIEVEIDSELLDEIVAITEYPKAILGEFEEEFLELPPEVIVTSMKTHQRYFSVYKGTKLSNHFVVVSNSLSDDVTNILNGNKRVLRARLSDALFFYRNDLKNGLDYEGLKEISFIGELGSLFDKTLRELKIAFTLFELYKTNLVSELGVQESEIKALLQRAIMLARADLLTQVVYEFPELQGIMGRYYAIAQREHPLICDAIKEQYLPSDKDSKLPNNLFSAIVALSVRIDSIFGLFSINQIPSGTKDPFALRRAANGILKIVKEFEISLNLIALYEKVKTEYRPFDINLVWNFVLERVYGLFIFNPSIIKAAIESQEKDILKLIQKIEAIGTISKESSFKELFSTFKRVANILKDQKEFSKLDASLFENSYEKELYDAFLAIPKELDYKERLELLFGLKPRLDAFFDNVMINDENMIIRNNRKALLYEIYQAFKEIADIKEIAV